MVVSEVSNHWVQWYFLQVATAWYKRTRKRLGAVNVHSEWWIFISEWKKCIDHWLNNFSGGQHQFSLMNKRKGIVYSRFMDDIIILIETKRQYTKARLSRTPQLQTQETKTQVHSRTYRRALEKVNVLRTYAVHPALIQHYLIRWASWCTKLQS